MATIYKNEPEIFKVSLQCPQAVSRPIYGTYEYNKGEKGENNLDID